MANPPVHVTTTRKSGVVTLTLHGHKSVNLIGRALMDALLATAAPLRDDPELRLIVVTGPPGGSFIGGADIAEMQALTPSTARVFINQLHAVCNLFRTLPVPSIARIEGLCIGGGMELAAACDIRVGTANSRYGMPEVQVGLPSVIEAALLPSLIGWGRTRELLYRGHIINAAEAERMGFLQHIAPEGKIDDTLAPIIDDILRADPGAIRTQKRLLERWLETDITSGIAASIEAFSDNFLTDAPNKRLAAFFEAKKKII